MTGVPTPKERAVHKFMLNFQRKHDGLSATFRAMADHFGWRSLNSGNCYMRSMVAKGLVKRVKLEGSKARYLARDVDLGPAPRVRKAAR